MVTFSRCLWVKKFATMGNIPHPVSHWSFFYFPLNIGYVLSYTYKNRAHALLANEQIKRQPLPKSAHEQ